MTRPPTARRPAPRARRLALIVLLAAAFAPGCGKKGPPLPPLVRVPARPEQFVARRLGSTVFLQVKIPAANSDATTPASLERVDIYGFTGSPDGNEDIFKYGTLVASIPVRKPPEPDETPKNDTKKDGKPVKPEDRPPSPPRPPASMENGFDQGDLVVVTEPLGPQQFAVVVPKRKKAPKVVEPALPIGPLPLGPAPRAPLPSRLYVAVGVNRKGQKGPASGRQAVLLTEPASAPAGTEVTYNETSISVTWTPPPDAWPPAPTGGKDSVLRATPIGTLSITGGYNVYEVPPPPPAPRASEPTSRAAAETPPGVSPGQLSKGASAQAPGAPSAQVPGGTAGQASSGPPVPPAPRGVMPMPLNAAPLPAPPFVDKRVTFGQERCFDVRAVTLFGAQPVEGDASPTRCVTPVDTFAPAPPKGLKAVAGGGTVNLVWDANTETDLAGYLVMRASLPGSDFRPLTTDLVKEATFNDTTAERGVRYAYVVVAVDTTGNRSARSNQVEETAR